MDEHKTYIHIETTTNSPTVDCTVNGTTSDLINCFAVGMASVMEQMSNKERLIFKTLINAGIENELANTEVSNNESSN